MAFGQHQMISSLHGGVLRIHVHDLKIQGGKYLGTGQGTARMPGLDAVKQINELVPEPAAQQL